MAQLDINPEGESQGIISATSSADSKIPKIKTPVQLAQVSRIAVFVVAVFVIAAILLFVIVQTQNFRIKYYNDKISAQDAELASLKEVETQATAIYGQVNNLKSLWLSRGFWSGVMKELSTTTTKSVKIQSMSLEETGTMTLNGATNSLASLAKFMTSLQQDKNFSQVQLTAVGFEGGVTTFTLTVNFSPTLLGGTPPAPEEAP